MTRAKKKLIIVTDNKYFTSNAIASVKNIRNTKQYVEPSKKTFIMGLSDLFISYKSQHDTQQIDLIAGSEVSIQEKYKNKPYFFLQNNLLIGQFSKKMHELIRSYEMSGYKISKVFIENVVEWFDEESKSSRTLPLCKIVMSK
jgi:hypothetical protein